MSFIVGEVLDDNTIAKLLKNDYIKRNQQIEIFLKILNSLNRHTVISIDGNWGSGKTVFIKQVEYINRIDAETLAEWPASDIKTETVAEFQEKYIAYYYNAWKNDYFDEPIQSLLFNLVNDLYNDVRLEALKKTLSMVDITGLVKNLSIGAINMEGKTRLSELVDEIRTACERKEAINKVINDFLPEDKKLVFIIDELDRCSPTFAVKLLEVIKHYYDNDNIVFVVVTNNNQLTHTVKKYYGNDFDASLYLNKFYDYIFGLSKVNLTEYASTFLDRDTRTNWLDILPVEIADSLDMSMRELIRYYESIDLVKNYITREHRWWRDNEVTRLMQWVFVPLALALRIKDFDRYNNFISGNGVNEITELYDKSESAVRIASNYLKSDPTTGIDEKTPLGIASEAYVEIFSDDSDNDWMKQEFRAVASLLNSFTTID